MWNSSRTATRYRAQLLASVDALLAEAGSGRDRVLAAVVHLRNMRRLRCHESGVAGLVARWSHTPQNAG